MRPYKNLTHRLVTSSILVGLLAAIPALPVAASGVGPGPDLPAASASAVTQDLVVAAATAAAVADAALDAATQDRVRVVDDWWRWVLLGDLVGGDPPDLVEATIRWDGARAERDRALNDLAVQVAVQVAGQSSGREPSADAAALAQAWQDTSDERRAVIVWALAQLGAPYVWGAAGTGRFDCSGFTLRAWSTVGVTLPHWSFGQNEQTVDIASTEARVGDLVLWDNGWNEQRGVRAGHVALMLGAGDLIVEATPPRVRVAALHTADEVVAYGRVEVPGGEAVSSPARVAPDDTFE